MSVALVTYSAYSCLSSVYRPSWVLWLNGAKRLSVCTEISQMEYEVDISIGTIGTPNGSQIWGGQVGAYFDSVNMAKRWQAEQHFALDVGKSWVGFRLA